MAKKWFIAAMVIVGLVVIAGLTVLIVWLVNSSNDSDTKPDITTTTEPTNPTDPTPPAPDSGLDFETIHLEGNGIGDIPQKFAYTRLARGAHTFWWFYEVHEQRKNTNVPNNKPVILWLDGLLGLPPSLLANFGMIGPYDFNLNIRDSSWINNYNLLFVDAPVGTGFSLFNNTNLISGDPEQYVEDLFSTVQSFYSEMEELRDNPFYIIGNGHGAKQALGLASKLYEDSRYKEINLQGLILGGPIISPALVLTKLGFYMEEWGYVDANGRAEIEQLSEETLRFVNEGKYADALSNFINLEDFINEKAGAVAVNLRHLVEKMTRAPSRDYFGQWKQLQSNMPDLDLNKFMNEVVAPALGIDETIHFDELHENALEAAKDTFMISDVEKVENILENTDINVYIYNGNLDVVSNTPGQLEWINNLNWTGKDEFLKSSRNVIGNNVIQAYERRSERLNFFWVNAAGQSTALDSPDAMKLIIQRII